LLRAAHACHPEGSYATRGISESRAVHHPEIPLIAKLPRDDTVINKWLCQGASL
jgi:hypothetical protein